MVGMSYSSLQNRSMDHFIASNMDSQWALPECLNIKGKFSLRGRLLSRRENSTKVWSEKNR